MFHIISTCPPLSTSLTLTSLGLSPSVSLHHPHLTTTIARIVDTEFARLGHGPPSLSLSLSLCPSHLPHLIFPTLSVLFYRLPTKNILNIPMLSNQECVFTKQAAKSFGLRVDGRDCLSVRPVTVRASCFPGAAGSAAVAVGSTSLVSVRVDIALGQPKDAPVTCTLVAASLSATVHAVVSRALACLATSLCHVRAADTPPISLTVTVAHPDADPPVNAVGIALWVALCHTRLPHMSEEMTRERDTDGGRTVARVVVSPALADAVPLIPPTVEVPLVLSVHRIDGMLMLDATATEIACADAGLLLALLPTSGAVVASQTLTPTTLRLAEVQTAVSHARRAAATLAPAIVEAQRQAVGGGETPDYLLTIHE
mmetsp:Transcript_2544/g.8117  ORF Transcript_2544/g.8117 Transcript_2544/m.8117 type:complete len:370 (-) Transcript_2544:3950-5059(-)